MTVAVLVLLVSVFAIGVCQLILTVHIASGLYDAKETAERWIGIIGNWVAEQNEGEPGSVPSQSFED